MVISSPPQDNLSIPDTLDSTVLLGRFLESCRQRGLAPDTVRFYEELLQSFIKRYPSLPQDPEPIEAWVGSYKSSQERRYAAFRAIRVFYNGLGKRYPGMSNPMSKLSKPRCKPKSKQPLTLEELRQLLEHPGHSERTRAMLLLLADSGLRIGEAVMVTRPDIVGDTLRVNGKTGERVVPLSPKVKAALLALKPEDDGRLFPGHVHWWTELISNAFMEAGVRGSAHLLRFTFASHWTGSDSALKQIGGWASWAMVQHYSQLRTETAIEQHREHSPMAKLYGRESPQNISQEIKPEALKSTSQDLPADPEVTRLKQEMLFYWYSLLSNVEREIGELFRRYAEDSEVNSFNKQYVTEALYDTYMSDLVKECADKDKMAESVGFIAKTFWKDLVKIAKRSSAEEYLKASRIQEDQSLLVGESIDELSISPAPMIWRQS